MRRVAAIIGILLWFSCARLSAQAIPSGTILPVQLNSSLKSQKAKPGQRVTARLMQDVPLPGSTLRSGATVIGRITAVRQASGQSDAQISIRFDTLKSGAKHIPIITNLRALASMLDVAEAQVPQSGPDRGTPDYWWTTTQIGGEVNYRGGGTIASGSEAVGHSVYDGVLVRVRAKPGTACRGDVDGNDRLQALWLFSSDACGLYDYPDLVLVHAGRTAPVGEITLGSTKGHLNIRAGSGMLLRVNQPGAVTRR